MVLAVRTALTRHHPRPPLHRLCVRRDGEGEGEADSDTEGEDDGDGDG
eukprot:CAMPEP_0174712366 /NCGR_PEP_ID=MMETSP1094-20130205/13389_1 /TAXON_ID=156173 /ORGANISM="Chrysochromulina brevifilum, Strain UTEX LB 985" /LENGTH=47 /DNA_ID= /DNA_START= /DNA_END= /DNA_ORIENTATION=